MSTLESKPLPPFLDSEASLDEFLDRFWKGTFPVAQWTHGAHVAMAAGVLWTEPVTPALSRIRDGIRHYNLSQGGENTPTSGYHETLTRLWVAAVASFLATLPEGVTRLEAVRAAYETFARQAGFFRCWYSFDVIKSRESRAAWVAPDRFLEALAAQAR